MSRTPPIQPGPMALPELTSASEYNQKNKKRESKKQDASRILKNEMRLYFHTRNNT